jgi:hypothetical protein
MSVLPQKPRPRSIAFGECTEEQAKSNELARRLDSDERDRIDDLIVRYATDWGRMRRTGLSRADLLRSFLEEAHGLK